MEQGLKIQVEELFAEADLVKWFTMLHKAVKDVKDKKPMFREPLENLDSKLEELNPLIKSIENKYSTKKKKKEKSVAKLKDVLDQPKWEVGKMVKQIENGNELVRKCSKLSPWNVFHALQLVDLKKCLNELLRILTEEGSRNALGKMVVSRENLRSVTTLADVTVGLDEPLRDLKNMFFKDNVSMLVLNGFGGYGKTTLAIKFCEDKEVKAIFKENMFFVRVSKEPNLDRIQVVRQRMAGPGPLLLVLDDVWSNSESLLQEFYDLKLQNYKILVTSRSEFPGFGTPYNLKALNDEDSMTLLRHSASLGDSSSVPEDLLREILKHCKGVPLAITVTGKSLRGQATEFWRSRLADWSKGSILDSETELLLCLQSSIDALGDKEAIIRECFMDLVSFPEDQRISAAAFIDMWAELYKLDEDFLSIKNLHELASRGLANLVITRNIEILDDYYIEHFVSQHDMLRELAIYNAKLDPIEDRKRLIVVSGDNQPINASRLCISSGGLISLFRKCKYVQKSQPINARLLSISSDGTFPTQWQSVHLPQVEVLVLNFKTENNALPEFVQKIDKLKVLIVTNYGLLPTELNNFDLLESLSNLKRIRLERISIHSITKNFVPLKSLKKISLFMCNMGQAFRNCSIKISDAWPGLEEMNIDYCHDLVELPAELCDLVHMKILSITNCHKLSALPEEIGKLENLEVLRLRSCTELVRLPVSIKGLTKLNLLDMYNCFSIKELPEGIDKMSSLREINVGQCLRLGELPESVLVLDVQLEKVICDEEKKHLWEHFIARDKIKVAKEQPNLDWLEMPPL
ncbi:disease resistance protein [Pyrus ussuriensis x Pyrus communis]|uniref:Disease resistance protein n=1 Tax=Pyrus ussuriensis x Pyrus communis TaxID=2448454 RepID=A0A5N5FML2_9ROSA|nr:disease resistance protein [Pyrus ussuriensis x Pyrus communis]